LFISGVGVPAPEDIPLTIAGFTTFKQCNDEFVFHSFLLTFIFVVIPILSGDLVAYHMGKRWGFGLRDRWKFLRSALSDARIAKVSDWFDKYGAFTVFMGRQVAGVRFVTFFTAGTMRVPLRKFVLFDFLGCMVSVPVWLTLGVLASRYGQHWLHYAMRRVGMSFLLGSIMAIVVFVLVVKLKKRTAPASHSQ
jgi:membrane protein DedA with SNARE-associated domain